jgi:hypothetical protein
LAVVSVLTTNDNGPLQPVYVSSAGAMLLCTTWLAIAVIGAESPAERAIITVAAGRSMRVLLASIATVWLGCVVLAVVGLVLPLCLGSHPVAGADLLVGMEAQLACAAIGTAVGVLCSRLVIRRQGYGLIAALSLLLAVVLVPVLSPVHALFRLMSSTSDAAELIAPVGGLLAVGVVSLAASSVAAQFIADRRA